ncbi:hypothetical protein WR25_19261 [Diploscapter pachys]|uniref:Uncharacterized protein n=1 Tax=Diploscapter pachys TaxID=2018661 RepID=A0A2A2L7N4_9BILA|nr:hypothetical protein WR25_19261 [Diploscapter pachys]
MALHWLVFLIFIARSFSSPLESEAIVRVKRESPETTEESQSDTVVHSEVVGSAGEEAETTTTAVPTSFQAPVIERLDAPIERIEIRLIDENTTKTHEDVKPEQAAQPEPEQAILEPRTPEAVTSTTEQPSEGDSNDIHERYKKIEYDVQPTEQVNGTSTSEVPPANMQQHPSEGMRQESDLQQATEDPTSDLPSTAADPSPVGLVDGYYTPTTSSISYEHDGQQKAEAKLWISLSTAMPAESESLGDIDEADLPPIATETDTQNEPEPVEECLANSDKLSEEVVERLKEETARLYRIVKQMNEQQHEYCKDDKKQRMNDEYRNCQSWREEKMIHYYKLMRKTYCQNVDSWPNAPKVKRSYGKYLQLFGTLYAFQK